MKLSIGILKELKGHVKEPANRPLLHDDALGDFYNDLKKSTIPLSFAQELDLLTALLRCPDRFLPDEDSYCEKVMQELAVTPEILRTINDLFEIEDWSQLPEDYVLDDFGNLIDPRELTFDEPKQTEKSKNAPLIKEDEEPDIQEKKRKTPAEIMEDMHYLSFRGEKDFYESALEAVNAEEPSYDDLMASLTCLTQLSEDRTWGEVFKHPIDSFMEWVMRIRLSKKIQDEFDMSKEEVQTQVDSTGTEFLKNRNERFLGEERQEKEKSPEEQDFAQKIELNFGAKNEPLAERPTVKNQTQPQITHNGPSDFV